MQTGPEGGILMWNSGLNEGLGILVMDGTTCQLQVDLLSSELAGLNWWELKCKKKKKKRERQWKQCRGIYQGLSETVGKTVNSK